MRVLLFLSQSAVFWCLCFLFLSALCFVVGVYLLFGPAWAIVECGACFFALAWFLRQGMIANG